MEHDWHKPSFNSFEPQSSPCSRVSQHNTTILKLECPPVTIYSAGYVNIADSKVPTQINHSATFQSKMAFCSKNLSQMVVGKHFAVQKLLSFRLSAVAMQLVVFELTKTLVRSSRKASPVHAVGYQNTTQQFLSQNVHQLLYIHLATSILPTLKCRLK